MNKTWKFAKFVSSFRAQTAFWAIVLFSIATGATTGLAAGMLVVPEAEVQFTPINPDLGERGPQRAVLFGKWNSGQPVGFFIKLPAGFSPGPHIHSGDGYIIVVKGTLYEFEPGASDKGKPVGPGGAWHTPANLAHDNYCAPASDCVFFVYSPNGNSFIPIQNGYHNPALAPHFTVRTANELQFVPTRPDLGEMSPMVSVLFGNMLKPGPTGLMVKLPAGFTPGPHTHTSDDYVVVLSGKMHNFAPGPDHGKTIGQGGFWHQVGDVPHDNICREGAECTFFGYFPNGFDFIPIQ